MTKNQAILLAMKALREYDQLGVIVDHHFVMRELMKCLPDTDQIQEQIAVSSMLTIQAIEKAKRG